MPGTHADDIAPPAAEGSLIRVASAQNQAEAELLQGLLLNAGVPSVLRRTRGFDVPDFLAAGPRDVLVAAASLAVAREVLGQANAAPLPSRTDAPATTDAPSRVLAGLLVALALVALIVWLATDLLV
jgi:hypothetical protein